MTDIPTVEPFLIAVAAVALLSIIKLLLPIVFTLLVTSRVMLTLLLLVIFDDDDRISLSITLEFVSLVVVVVVIFVVVDVLFWVGLFLLSLVFVVVVFVFIYTIPIGTELSFVLLDVSDIDVIGDALFLVIRTDVGICAG